MTSPTIYTETFNCDGTNLICAGQPITCTNNEPCIITCTGADDCIGTTITCPTNGDCTIECHNSATEDGCKASSIIATNSLSLSIDNQGVIRGFQSVPIYCPLNNNCILSGSGNSAFEFVQIYSIFGFVFNQISISCSGVQSRQCNNQITIHCGNNYISSCIIDSLTNNKCSGNTPLICDTIFTSITNIWNDNYLINPAPGWTVTDFNNNSISNTFIGTHNTYHGPFYGDAISGTLDIYSLTQHFYCSNASKNVYVEYTYGYSCQESQDYSKLYLNNQLIAHKHADSNTGQPFQDDLLETEVFTHCNDAWKQKSLNGSLGFIQANTLFKIEIKVALNYDQEVSIISDFKIICQPLDPTTAIPTNVPTTAQPSINPSISPITSIPTISPISSNPSIAPSNIPSDMPTDMPTALPTQTIAPSDSPIIEPTMNSISPSIYPSEAPIVPSNMPTTIPIEIYHTLNTENVIEEDEQKKEEDEEDSALWTVIGVIGFLFIIVGLVAIFHTKRCKSAYESVNTEKESVQYAIKLQE